ncbi:hypothetical protein QBC35DRAFT_211406 [Podospora australis]|uniref:Uncharacterized protein n=1 Tax=Podospora australis TaxID=1536484 RepID=A0AAN6WV66_9PEZI|nr:hypothetical protein QBC35DRAFT_211406 [Podospora australis]
MVFGFGSKDKDKSSDDGYVRTVAPRPPTLIHAGTRSLQSTRNWGWRPHPASHPTLTGYYAPSTSQSSAAPVMNEDEDSVRGFMQRYKITRYEGKSKLWSVFRWVDETIARNHHEIIDTKKAMDVLKKEKVEEIDRLNKKFYGLAAEIDNHKTRAKETAAMLEKWGEYWSAAESEKEQLRQEIQKLKEEHITALAQTKKKHDDDLAAEQERLHGEITKLNKSILKKDKEISKLKDQNAAYSKEDAGLITDEEFQANATSLSKQLVSLATMTRGSQPDTRAWSRHIRSLCWKHLLLGFFEYPHGFGVFGTGNEGMDILSQFYDMIADPQNPGSLTIPNTPQENDWRGYIFEKILQDVRAGVGEKAITGWFEDNVLLVTQSLTAAIQQQCPYGLTEEIYTAIQKIVRNAGILALEMGSQRSHVYFQGCTPGDKIDAPLQSKFADENGLNLETGATVEIMTMPCLIRLGDGKVDLVTEVVLLQGKIIPARSWT